MSDIEILAKIRPLIDHGRFGYMTKEPLKEWVRERIDLANTSAAKPWNYAHIADGFLMGQADENMMILTEKESIRMWSLCTYMMMARVPPQSAI